MTRLDTSKIATIWSPEQENTRSLKKKKTESEKVSKILQLPIQYWEIILSFYYISWSQIIPPRVTHLNILQKATIWSLELENTISL